MNGLAVSCAGEVLTRPERAETGGKALKVAFRVCIHDGRAYVSHSQYVRVHCYDRLAESCLQVLDVGACVGVHGFLRATARYVDFSGRERSDLIIEAGSLELLQRADLADWRAELVPTNPYFATAIVLEEVTP